MFLASADLGIFSCLACPVHISSMFVFTCVTLDVLVINLFLQYVFCFVCLLLCWNCQVRM